MWQVELYRYFQLKIQGINLTSVLDKYTTTTSEIERQIFEYTGLRANVTYQYSHIKRQVDISANRNGQKASSADSSLLDVDKSFEPNDLLHNFTPYIAISKNDKLMCSEVHGEHCKEAKLALFGRSSGKEDNTDSCKFNGDKICYAYIQSQTESPWLGLTLEKLPAYFPERTFRVSLAFPQKTVPFSNHEGQKIEVFYSQTFPVDGSTNDVFPDLVVEEKAWLEVAENQTYLEGSASTPSNEYRARPVDVFSGSKALFFPGPISAFYVTETVSFGYGDTFTIWLRWETTNVADVKLRENSIFELADVISGRFVRLEAVACDGEHVGKADLRFVMGRNFTSSDTGRIDFAATTTGCEFPENTWKHIALKTNDFESEPTDFVHFFIDAVKIDPCKRLS